MPLLTALDHLRKPSIPFQSKHIPALKRGPWYALRRPADRARTGLLCVWPEHRCCAYISGEPPSVKRPTPRIALLRLRIDPQFFATAGLTVFSATLSATARRLWVEDTLIWKGRPISEEEPFTKRWQRAVQWLEHYAIRDPRLLDGLEIEMAPWQPLTAVEPEGIWELQVDEPARRRLYWISNHAPPLYQSPTLGGAPVPPVAAIPELDLGEATGPLVAIAMREGGPDQWGLTSADGKQLGRLLVRTLTLSMGLRAIKGNVARVEVEWSAVFGKWEIKALSSALASHSTLFGLTSKSQ